MTKDQFKHEGNNSEPSAGKTQNMTSLVTAFTLLGGAGILVGIINLIRALPSGFSGVQLTDAVFNAVFGILFLISAQVLAKRKAWVIWLVSGTILASIIYSFATERGFNLLIAIIGAFFLWRLIALKKQGTLL